MIKPTARREMPGFTRKPGIREILDPSEKLAREDWDINPSDDVLHWQGLTVDNAIRLMELLPAWQQDVTQNESPSIKEQIEIGLQHPGTEFFGYRVAPERADERINFEGFKISKAAMPASVAEELYQRLGPDLTWDQVDAGDVWHFWWD